jgi:hypothetical protein
MQRIYIDIDFTILYIYIYINTLRVKKAVPPPTKICTPLKGHGLVENTMRTRSHTMPRPTLRCGIGRSWVPTLPPMPVALQFDRNLWRKGLASDLRCVRGIDDV